MNNLSYVADVTELNRYNRKALNQSFDADAIDGDGDGMVQDNTPFERPAVIGAIDAAIEKTKRALEAGKALGEQAKRVHRKRHSKMSNAEIVESVVPDTLEGLMAQFAEQAVAYLSANPLRRKRAEIDRKEVIDYIQQQIKELTGVDTGNDIPFDFSPTKIRALRETLAKNLDSSPQFRQLVDDFGMPPLFIFNDDLRASFAGIYSHDFGIGFSQDGMKKNTIAQRLSNTAFAKILARLTPEHQFGGNKKSRRWVVENGLRHTMLHEFGHHVGRTLGEDYKDSGNERLKKLAQYINSHQWTTDLLPNFDKQGNIFANLLDNPDWDKQWKDRGDLPDEMPFVRSVYSETSPVEQFAEAMSALLSPETNDDDLVSGGMQGIISELLELDPNTGLVEQLQDRQSHTPQARVEIQGFASRGTDVLTPAGNKEKWHPIYKDMTASEIADELVPSDFDEMVNALIAGNSRGDYEVQRKRAITYLMSSFGAKSEEELMSFFDFQDAALLKVGKQQILENQPAFFRHHQMYGAPISVALSKKGHKQLGDDFAGMYFGLKNLDVGLVVYPPDHLGEIRHHDLYNTPEEIKPFKFVQSILKWRMKTPEGVQYFLVDGDGDGTVRHEYGHFIHGNLLRQLRRAGLQDSEAYNVLDSFLSETWEEFFEKTNWPEWKEQYDNRKRKPRSPDFPEVNSMYGWTSPIEMFAEAYTAYTSPYPEERELLSPGMRKAMDIVFGNDPAQDSVEQLTDGFASRGGTPEVEPEEVIPFLEGRSTKTGWGPFKEEATVKRSELFANTSTEQKIAYAVPTTREEYVMMTFDHTIQAAGLEQMFIDAGLKIGDIRRLIDMKDLDNIKARRTWIAPLVAHVNKTMKLHPPDLSPEAVAKAQQILRDSLDTSPALRHYAEKFGLPPLVMGSERSRNRMLLMHALAKDVDTSSIIGGFQMGRVSKVVDEILDNPEELNKLIGPFLENDNFPFAAGFFPGTGNIQIFPGTRVAKNLDEGRRVNLGHVPKAGDLLVLDESPESIFLHEYAHYLDNQIELGIKRGTIDPDSRIAKAHRLLHSGDVATGLRLRRENPTWTSDVLPTIDTTYGNYNADELIAESISAILSGNPHVFDVMNKPLQDAAYDFLDVPEFDAPGGAKERRVPWIRDFTPQPEVARGFASRGSMDTTIPAQTMSDTKRRRGFKKLKPRYFETADGEKLELYHNDSVTDTFIVRRYGKGVARVSVVEDNNGLPQMTVMNIDSGYDAELIESELTKFVKEYYPNARRPEGKTSTVRKVEVAGFASRGDNEVPLDKVDVTTPAGISAVKEQLQRSKDDNKTATFMYNGALRRVEVKNIYEKDGITYVDGFDKTRGAGRTFRVDRMEAATVIGTGKEAVTVEPPKEPREPVAPYTGKAADIFEGATSFRQVYERLTPGELVFFDFETTGIEEDENKIMTNGGKPVQMGIIRVIDGKVVERKNMYINPGQPLGGWSKDNLKRTDENGVEVPLTDEWLQQQPSIAQAMAEALDFIGENKVMGGQYQIFDQRVMEEALKGTGLEGRWKPAGFIDSKGIIDHLYEDNDVDRPKSNRLGALADHYGVELTNWHSADADAEAAWAVVEAAIRRAADREDSRTGSPVKRTLLSADKTNGIHDNNHATWQGQHTEWKSTMVDIGETKRKAASEPGFASRGTVEKPLDGRDIVARASAGPKVTDANRKQAALDALADVRTRLTGVLRDQWDEIVEDVDRNWEKYKKNKTVRDVVKMGIKLSKMAGKMAIAKQLGNVPVNTEQVDLLAAFVDSGLEDALRIGGVEMVAFLLKDFVANQVIDRERAKEIFANVKEALAERTEAITQMSREMIGRMGDAWEAVASRMKKRPKGFIPLNEPDPDFGGIVLSTSGRMADVPELVSVKSAQWAEIAVRDFTRHAPEQFTKSMKYTKPALRERIKNQVMAGSDGGKPGQWSARKAQLVAQKYRDAGGGYRGKPSKTQRSLKKWTKERWRTSDGKPADRPGGTRRYLPDSAWEKLTPGQRAATNRKKVEGSRAGRQFVPNTESAAKAGKKARKGK